MDIQNLREAQVRYENRKEAIINSKENLYQVRLAFVTYFNRNKITNMQIDDYVIGVKLPQIGFNFCYGLERQLDGLGRIFGSTAFKFGIYYGQTKAEINCEYRFAKKFGTTYQIAFNNVRKAIMDLLNAGENENYVEIVNNNLSPMFKGKILSTYFPEKYLNIFSSDHLNYYLEKLDLQTSYLFKGDAVYKRKALINFKNQDPVMKNWSVDLFATFLWSEFPGRPL